VRKDRGVLNGRVRATAASIVVAMWAMGCGSNGSATSSVPVSHVELVSAGVLRVHWTHSGAAADLNIRRLTEMDGVPIPEPPCARDAGGSHPVFFDVNWRAVRQDHSVPKATLSVSTAPGQDITVVEPDGRCRLLTDYDLEEVPARTQRVLQLIASGEESSLHQLKVVVDGRQVVFPLVPVCGPSGQPPAQSCTLDPVSYVSGAPFSFDLQL
jgi:hypothetical protein